MKAKSVKKWTILNYANGNNEYEPEMYKAFIDSQKLGSNENVNIVMEIGRLEREAAAIIRNENFNPSKEKTWSGVRRYYIEKNEALLIKELGNINMADPGALYQFLYWGIRNYPAEHYMVILGGHGASFLGTLTDYSQNLPCIMGTSDMCRAFNLISKHTGKKIDILILDICYMNLGEILYEFGCREGHTVQNVITYIDTGPVSGIPFDKLISTIYNDWNSGDIEHLLKKIVESLNFDLAAFRIIQEDLIKIKRLSNDLAYSYLCSSWSGKKNISELLNETNPEFPWYQHSAALKEKLSNLIVSRRTVRNTKSSLIKLIDREINELVKVYRRLEFSRDNFWTNLVGNIPLNEKIDYNNRSFFEPYIIKPDGFRTLISIMNPYLKKEGVEEIFKKFIELKGWVWELDKKE